MTVMQNRTTISIVPRSREKSSGPESGPNEVAGDVENYVHWTPRDRTAFFHTTSRAMDRKLRRLRGAVLIETFQDLRGAWSGSAWSLPVSSILPRAARDVTPRQRELGRQLAARMRDKARTRPTQVADCKLPSRGSFLLDGGHSGETVDPSRSGPQARVGGAA